MRTIRIDLTQPPSRAVDAGVKGEQNAAVLHLIPPAEVSSEAAYYRIAFEWNAGVVLTDALALTDGEVVYTLSTPLTNQNPLPFTLEGYRADGSYVGKSSLVSLAFGHAVVGCLTDPTAGDAQTIGKEVAANTAARHTHENKDVLDEIGMEDNLPTWQGSSWPGGGGGGTGDHRHLTNRDAPNQHPASAITGFEPAVQSILENAIIDGGTFDG